MGRPYRVEFCSTRPNEIKTKFLTLVHYGFLSKHNFLNVTYRAYVLHLYTAFRTKIDRKNVKLNKSLRFLQWVCSIFAACLVFAPQKPLSRASSNFFLIKRGLEFSKRRNKQKEMGKFWANCSTYSVAIPETYYIPYTIKIYLILSMLLSQ